MNFGGVLHELGGPIVGLTTFQKKYTCNDIDNRKMHEGICLKSECTGGRENCEKILKRMHCFKREPRKDRKI